MFDIKNLSIKLTKNSCEIINNLNLSLGKGTKLAIIGEEGDGKSTLVKAISGLDISSYAEISGKVNINNIKIGYLPQNLNDKILEMSVSEYLLYDEVLDEIDYSFFDEFKLISKLFSDFNLNIELIDEPKTLSCMSGGERLKLQLIKLIGKNPDLLVLDEPTNDLDIESLAVLENFICNDNRPIIFVSHDEKLLENTANAILHIERLKKKTESKWTYARKDYKTYIEDRKNMLDRQDQIASNKRDKFEAKMERWRKIYNQVDSDINSISRQDPHGGKLLKKKMKSVKAQEKRFEKERENLPEFSDSEESIYLKFKENKLDKNQIIANIKIDSLCISNKILSKNIDLNIKGKDKIVIIGKNGTGKTTLIKRIIKDLSNNCKIKVGYLPQDLDDEFDGFESVIAYAEENAYSKEDRTRIRTFLGTLKFTETEILERIDGLSGGSKVKLALAKLMMKGCDLLVLDEPTRNLSPLSNPELRRALKEFNGAILSVSHDRKFIEEVANNVYELTSMGLIDVTDKIKNSISI